MDDQRAILLAGVAHDLRTPLTNVGLAIELLSKEGHSELIDSVRHDIKVLDALIAQLLTFARARTAMRSRSQVSTASRNRSF
jgi:two-component system, OmpR family, osmolarity sensor histidine kinase EnvZ